MQAAYFHTLILLSFHQLREIELRVQREINEKRQELLAKEESLRYVHVAITQQALQLITACHHSNLESRLAAQGSQSDFPQ